MGTNLGLGGVGEGARARNPTREGLHLDDERAQRHGTVGPVGGRWSLRIRRRAARLGFGCFFLLGRGEKCASSVDPSLDPLFLLIPQKKNTRRKSQSRLRSERNPLQSATTTARCSQPISAKRSGSNDSLAKIV